MIYNMPNTLWVKLHNMLLENKISVDGESRFLVDNWLSNEYGLIALDESYVDMCYSYQATDDVKLVEFILRWT